MRKLNVNSYLKWKFKQISKMKQFEKTLKYAKIS